MPNPLADATSKLLDVLSPLESQDRLRVVQAVLTLLGENSSVKAAVAAVKNRETQDQSAASDDDASEEFPAQGKAWLRKHSVSREQLEHALHIDKGKVQPIALPGTATKKIDQVQAAYLVQGIAALLETGEAGFSDEAARTSCEHFGCYDSTNHAKYVKSLGNRLTGSKSTGWKLTAPGLAAAAELIKQTLSNAK
jgi:hypothetical protein